MPDNPSSLGQGETNSSLEPKVRVQPSYRIRNHLANKHSGFNSEPDTDQPTQGPKRIPKSKSNLGNDEQQTATRKPPIDYLREMKSKREQQHPQRMSHEIDKVLRSQEMSEAEKYQIVRMKTEQMEQRAEQEERVLQVLGGNQEREVERAIEVNDMYIESIKAKLKMLD